MLTITAQESEIKTAKEEIPCRYAGENILKGDLKQFFIEDYILWMTKESTGVQRLDKEVRGIFWRNMPFPQALKEELKKRSLVYDELCIKDNNRAMSDGY